MKCRALLIKYRALLIKCRALLIKCRALLIKCRIDVHAGMAQHVNKCMYIFYTFCHAKAISIKRHSMMTTRKSRRVNAKFVQKDLRMRKTSYTYGKNPQMRFIHVEREPQKRRKYSERDAQNKHIDVERSSQKRPVYVQGDQPKTHGYMERNPRTRAMFFERNLQKRPTCV